MKSDEQLMPKYNVKIPNNNNTINNRISSLLNMLVIIVNTYLLHLEYSYFLLNESNHYLL